MRRALLGVAGAALVLTGLPAVAAEPFESESGSSEEVVAEPIPVEPELLEPCAPRPGTQVLTPEGFDGTVATPAPPFGETPTTFVLDLAGLPVGTTASADATMTWGIPTNDFDLSVNGVDGNNIQPIDEARENVFTSGLRHCASLDVVAVNFLAPVVVDTLALDVVVKTKLPA